MAAENAISTDSYNLATKTRWVLTLPIEKLFGVDYQINNFNVNVYAFEIPEIEVGFNEISYLGYDIPMPNGIRADEKILTVGFNVSSNLLQYAVFYGLIAASTSFPEVNSTTLESPYGAAMNMELCILDEYMKPTSVFKFQGAMINKLGRLVLDQSDQEGAILKCSATFRYYKLDFDFTSILKNLAT